MHGVQCGAIVVSGFQALRVWLVGRFWGAGVLALVRKEEGPGKPGHFLPLSQN